MSRLLSCSSPIFHVTKPCGLYDFVRLCQLLPFYALCSCLYNLKILISSDSVRTLKTHSSLLNVSACSHKALYAVSLPSDSRTYMRVERDSIHVLSYVRNMLTSSSSSIALRPPQHGSLASSCSLTVSCKCNATAGPKIKTLLKRVLRHNFTARPQNIVLCLPKLVNQAAHFAAARGLFSR
jgi:hypothetical protein